MKLIPFQSGMYSNLFSALFLSVGAHDYETIGIANLQIFEQLERHKSLNVTDMRIFESAKIWNTTPWIDARKVELPLRDSNASDGDKEPPKSKNESAMLLTLQREKTMRELIGQSRCKPEIFSISASGLELLVHGCSLSLHELFVAFQLVRSQLCAFQALPVWA